MSYNEFLQKSIDEINRRVESDSELKDVLKKYDGKRLVLNLMNDATYAINISSENVSLETSATSNEEDMYLEIDKEVIKKILNQEMNMLQAASLLLTGKIKIRNIGMEEFDLVQKFFGSITS